MAVKVNYSVTGLNFVKKKKQIFCISRWRFTFVGGEEIKFQQKC